MSRKRFYGIAYASFFAAFILILFVSGREPLSILGFAALWLLLGSFICFIPIVGAIVNVVARETWERLLVLEDDSGDETTSMILCTMSVATFVLSGYLLVAFLGGRLIPQMWSGNMNRLAPEPWQRVRIVGLTHENRDEIGASLNVDFSSRAMKSLPMAAYQTLKDNPAALKMVVLDQHLRGYNGRIGNMAKLAIEDLRALGQDDLVNECFLEAIASAGGDSWNSARMLAPYVTDRAAILAASRMRDANWPDDVRALFKNRLAELDGGN